MKLSTVAFIFAAAVAVPALIVATWDNSALASATGEANQTQDIPFTCAYTGLSASISVGPDTSDSDIDALIDGACKAYEETFTEPETVETCFDASGMVTEGDDWKECFYVVKGKQ